MTTIIQQDLSRLTGPQRVAIVLLSISEENAIKMFKLMSEDEIREVSYAMSSLGAIPSETIDMLLKQFNNDLIGNSLFLGNLETTEKLLEKVLDHEQVQVLMDELRGPLGKTTWDKLTNVNDELLSLYLTNEHPQIAAVVLSKMNPAHTAKILSNLQDDSAFDIVTRMLNIGSIKREILERLEKAIRAEFIVTMGKTLKQDSFQMIAGIFNSLDRTKESTYMHMLENNHPEAAEKIKNFMFTFEDLVRIDPRGIQKLLRVIDKIKLTIALKGSSEEIKKLFFMNMSQRAARIVKDEIESLGPIRVKEVDEAQLHIVNCAKQLIEKAEIDIADVGKDEYI